MANQVALGLSSLIVGFGGRFVLQPDEEMQALFSNPLVRHLLFFLIVYSATRNIGVSAVVSTLFIFFGTVVEAPLKTLVRRGYRIEFRQPWLLVATAKS